MEQTNCENCGAVIKPIHLYKYSKNTFECPKCKALWTIVDLKYDE
jgi:predicted Zn-ribbon and HTH transcriptional regulator